MKIENLCKSYKNTVVYDRFNLEIEDGKITCILGESGSGKTTLLNVLAGLTDYKGNVPALKPSYIFQTPRLVPNLTVRGNLRLVCADDGKIDDILRQAEIYDKAEEYPVRLSGGQAQRVAICRAFLFGSDIILMDEPFSSLDLKLKIKMADMFSDLWRRDKKTALFVTHDVDEAVYLSDRIVVIGGGKIIFDVKNGQSARAYGEDSPVRRELLRAVLS